MSTVNSTPEQPAKRAIRAIAGTNLDGASAHNRRVIFDALRINGALTRADLARATQLTPQTVSNIVDSLRSDGLIVADEPRRQGRGQPARPYRILPEVACAPRARRTPPAGPGPAGPPLSHPARGRLRHRRPARPAPDAGRRC